MRRWFTRKQDLFKSVWAGLAAVLFLAMTLIGASERLHAQLHAGEEGHNHSPCAVCAIVKGQVDTPVAGVSEVFASLSVAWTLPVCQPVSLSSVDLAIMPNRGPPASVSSSS